MKAQVDPAGASLQHRQFTEGMNSRRDLEGVPLNYGSLYTLYIRQLAELQAATILISSATNKIGD